MKTGLKISLKVSSFGAELILKSEQNGSRKRESWRQNSTQVENWSTGRSILLQLRVAVIDQACHERFVRRITKNCWVFTSLLSSCIWTGRQRMRGIWAFFGQHMHGRLDFPVTRHANIRLAALLGYVDLLRSLFPRAALPHGRISAFFTERLRFNRSSLWTILFEMTWFFELNLLY